MTSEYQLLFHVHTEENLEHLIKCQDWFHIFKFEFSGSALQKLPIIKQKFKKESNKTQMKYCFVKEVTSCSKGLCINHFSETDLVARDSDEDNWYNPYN